MSTGTALHTWLPVPSWPKRLLPQQNARPSAVIPHVSSGPAVTWMNVIPPNTGTGTAAELLSNVVDRG